MPLIRATNNGATGAARSGTSASNVGRPHRSQDARPKPTERGLFTCILNADMTKEAGEGGSRGRSHPGSAVGCTSKYSTKDRERMGGVKGEASVREGGIELEKRPGVSQHQAGGSRIGGGRRGEERGKSPEDLYSHRIRYSCFISAPAGLLF